MNASTNPIMSLRGDNEIARQAIEKLSNHLKKIYSGDPKSEVKGLINQLEEFIPAVEKYIKIQFKVEEEALFPVLGNYIGLETGPIHVMIIEHNNAKKLFEEFRKSIDDFDPVSNNYKNIISTGNSLIALLSEHVEKEDNILLNMADMHLSDEEKKSVMENIKKFDK